MALFQKEESYLGVDIGAGGIKLVELKKTKDRPQLWTYGVLDEPLDIHIDRPTDKSPEALLAEQPGGPQLTAPSTASPVHLDDVRIDTYAGYLRQLVKQSRATSKHVVASIPVSYIFHTVVTLPIIDKKEQQEAIIHAQVDKLMTRSVTEMQVVYQEIPQTDIEKEKKYQRYLVTAAPKEVVQFYSAIFQRAGLQLEELETEAFAIERSLVGKDYSTVMVVDIGSERTNFFIMDQGLPMTHRSIQIGGDTISRILERTTGLTGQELEQVKYDMSYISPERIPVDTFRACLDPITKEVQNSFDLYLRQQAHMHKHPEKIILTGGSSVFPIIAHHLRKTFDKKVFVGDPWSRTVYQDTLRPLLDANGSRMSVAVGLALRNIIPD
jgi:type IV pilus assembly protein PilM